MLEIGPGEIADALARLESRALGVYPQQCVRSRHRKAKCTLCADNCPTGAITWNDPAQIDTAKCIGCGLCAAVCPTGVFEASSPTNAEILQQIEGLAKTTSTIVFACPQVVGEDARGVIRVTCLGRLDASVLIGAAAMGMQQIELVDSECQSCPYNIGHAVAEQAIAESNALLPAFGIAPCVAFVAQNSLLGQPTLRTKQMTRVEVEHTSDESAHATKLTLKKGELPVRVPTKNQLLLSSLRRLANRVGNPELDTDLWATVAIKDSCTGCQMCAFFCPTGALFKVVEDGKPGLAFKYADCTDCQLCQEICYTASIELAARVDLRKVIAQTIEVVWSNTPTSSHEEKLKRLRMFR